MRRFLLFRSLVKNYLELKSLYNEKCLFKESDKALPGGQEPYSIPKEIWFLIDHLYRHGLKESLFVQPGLHSEILQIRNWLDHGSSEPLRILFKKL